MSQEDADLLRCYAEEKSEPAFAELVRRHLDLVYSVALRQVGGDAHLAQDVAQVVFAALARKAASLAARPVLGGWLYRTTQFAAIDAVRADHRRRTREREAHTMHELSANPDNHADWEKLRPTLDQAIGELRDDDRDAVVLRFFEGKSFADVGARLHLPENTARMRVERALDKLHGALARRGVTSTSAALAVALANQAGVAAPAGLAATVTGAVLTGTTAGLGGGLAAFMSITKLQIGIASAVAVAGGTGYVLQARINADLRHEIATAKIVQQDIAALRTENQRLASAAAEVEMLRRDDAELKQLAQSATEAKKANDENARVTRLREVQRSQSQGTQSVQAEIDQLNREGNALVEEFKALNEKAKDSLLAPEIKAEAQAAAAAKLEAIKRQQLAIKTFTENARANGWVPPPSAGRLEFRRSVPGQVGSSAATPPPAASASGSPP